jgi:hypothetical protein
MYVTEPFNILGGLLTSSTVPEPDASVGEVVWTAGTYNTGDRRIVAATHKLYEVVATPSTTDDPVIGAAKAVPTWIEVSYTNRFRMFDQVNSSQTTEASPLVVEITSAKGFNSAAIFNANGVTSVRYQVHTAAGALSYDKTIEAIDNSDVVDYWEYFNLSIIQRFKFIVNDIPRSVGAKLTVTITGAANVSVGTLVIGNVISLGVTCYGPTGFDFIDLSQVDENAFGDLVITPKRDYKLVNYDVRTEKTKIDFAVNILKSLKGKPCVYSGTKDTDDATAVFGVLRKFQQNIDSPVKCTATIQVRELV